MEDITHRLDLERMLWDPNHDDIAYEYRVDNKTENALMVASIHTVLHDISS
jgi:hypothetical protein